jgi:excisionase family DNA binding protein
MEEWLELAEAARLVGIHPSTLRRWADAGKVPHRRTVNGRRRFSRTDMDQVRKDQQRQPPLSEASQMEALETRALEQTRAHTRQFPAEQADWSRLLSDEQRILFRYSGRQLLDLLIRFIRPGSHAEPLLEEAQQIARDYGKVCFGIGLTLPQTVEAFFYFKLSILESAQAADGMQSLNPADGYGVFLRMVNFFDALLVTTIKSYSQAGR